MKHCLVREWGYVQLDEGGSANTLNRNEANSLLAAARKAKLGTSFGESVLLDGFRRIRAQQVVGIISTKAATLEILPKIDGLDDGGTRKQLIHMLAKVYDLNIASGDLANVGWQRHDLLEILISLFCDKLFDAVRRGLPKSYVGEEADLTVLRGRLDAQRQFTIRAAAPQRLACRYEEHSVDIALNQVMKAAVERLLTASRRAGNQRRLRELLFSYADVRSVSIKELAWNKVVVDRTNSSWKCLLELARLLLGDRFQTVSSGGGTGFSLLFEMNTLFEEYIGRVLARGLKDTALDVRLQGPTSHALMDRSGVRRFRTKPDIVVCHHGAPVVVIDTKWKRLSNELDDAKRGVGQSDVYQMIAYAQVYGCARLILLYPHHGQIRSTEGPLETYRVLGTADTQLTIMCISLVNLEMIADRLCEMVLSQLEGFPLARKAA